MLPSRVADVPITSPHDGAITLGTDTTGTYATAIDNNGVCEFDDSGRIPDSCVGDSYIIRKDGRMEKVR
jgi:hypothetical protein